MVRGKKKLADAPAPQVGDVVRVTGWRGIDPEDDIKLAGFFDSAEWGRCARGWVIDKGHAWKNVFFPVVCIVRPVKYEHVKHGHWLVKWWDKDEEFQGSEAAVKERISSAGFTPQSAVAW